MYDREIGREFLTHVTNIWGDDKLLEMTGSRACALNMHLEHIFGHAPRSRGDGVLSILEMVARYVLILLKFLFLTFSNIACVTNS